MNNVMLDLETMGNGSNAAITAIGAVEFDFERMELGREFYMLVDLESSVKAGGIMDPSTVLWWMKQSDDARRQFEEVGSPIHLALGDFRAWLGGESVKMWGNGATFDNVILGNAYKRLNMTAPWPFYNDRCYRTLKNLYPERKMVPFEGTKHNALDDAKNQAKHAIDIYADCIVKRDAEGMIVRVSP